MQYKLTIAGLIFVLVFTTVPIQQAYACDFVLHPERCVKDLINDIVDPEINLVKEKISKVEKAAEKEISTVKKDLTHEISLVEQDVDSLESVLIKEIKIVEKDIVKIAGDVESVEQAVVNDVVTDVKDIEGALVNDIVKDVKDIKADVNKIEDIVKAVVAIEQKVVHITEEVFEAIVHDFFKDMKFIVYVIIAIIVGYLIIRIIQFIVWLKAYLRQDSIEHIGKQQVKQNAEIIDLLKKISKE